MSLTRKQLFLLPPSPPWRNVSLSQAGFILFWTFEIPWLSMTFSTTFHHINLIIFKEIFQKIVLILVSLCFISQEKKMTRFLILYNKHHFPCLSRPGKWSPKLLWLSRFFPPHPALNLSWYPFIHLGAERHYESKFKVFCPRTKHIVPVKALIQTTWSGD